MDDIYLRKVENSDIDLLYEWANDPTVRKNSFNTEPIPYEKHTTWFSQMMEDETVLQFVLMKKDTPIGQIRLNIEGDAAEIGYSIAKEYRGQGFGHIILRLVKDLITEKHPAIQRIIAKVKPENIASNKLFQTEGYVLQYSCYLREIDRTGM